MPALAKPVLDGRDARQFPGVSLRFVTLGDVLVPLERGEMVRETAAGKVPSYWRVIPQFGRVWREQADGDWSRAALPLMLVNDTENHAHQGLATFLYQDGKISSLRVQFVQQTAPYLLSPHCVLWGSIPATVSSVDPARIEQERAVATAELAARLPARPLAELRANLPPGTLDGFGGPILPKWQVALGLVRDGTLYYEASPTAYGSYPYPLEMRFGVRSVMKAVAPPLALLRLAEVYGPYVLGLRIGDYVPGLDPKWNRIRFIDAANMATGFGGTGTFKTHPNDDGDGYLDGNYDAWYTAHSHADKLAQINANLRPYPWEPGTVMRYRDQDHYLLGIAVDRFLKSVRGPDADAWKMLQEEVFEPIGIAHAPAVRTREPGGRDGPVWFNAGYYPTLDDLAKIALLFEDEGRHGGKQLLHRELTRDLLAARGAIDKQGDDSFPAADARPGSPPARLYKMGFHFTPYVGSRSHQLRYLPTMSGFGDNEVILFPGRVVAIRAARVAEVPKDEKARSDDADATVRAIDRLAPF
ncbi:MAG: beta-lactamase family protein [Gammaproteobacteria bacterium]|nr:beta-lactamase family protein [Gammaproteobacteria bacterium]